MRGGGGDSTPVECSFLKIPSYRRTEEEEEEIQRRSSVVALNDHPASPWCVPTHLTYPYHRCDGARISPRLYRRKPKLTANL